ncbi:MAG: sugar ABC transporter ATP-binding protein [Lachnospiraceae bacterium]|nr:sugar ABC transporter ATP-binding protein [Lachnospiraceae bacterium]
MKHEILRFENVTYKENGVTKLDDFNLQVYKGEIVGMYPINSHGLAGFLKLLQQNLSLEHGYIFYAEEMINSWKEAQNAYNRISIVRTKSCLVEALSVTDNVFVVSKGYRKELIQTPLLKKQLKPFLEEIDFQISLDAYVKKLTYFERVVVEILKARVHGYRLIVLNDVSEQLSKVEVKKLHQMMRLYASKGISFLYINSHFNELRQVCGRTLLLSYGRIVKTLGEKEMNGTNYLEYEDIYTNSIREKEKYSPKGEERRTVVWETKNLSLNEMHNLNLKIHNGECVVLQMVDHNLFRDFINLISGEEAPDGGLVCSEGKKVKMAMNSSFAVIQSQPTQTMLFKNMSYMDNLCFGILWRLNKRWDRKSIMESVKNEYVSLLGDKVFNMNVEDLSERQKYQLVYTRILLQKPKVVFCIQPFNGADLPHRRCVIDLMNILLKAGIAVAIVTINILDSMMVADRLLQIEQDGTVVDVSGEKNKILEQRFQEIEQTE